MGFLRQENWSGFLFPPPGDLPNSGNEAASPAWQADSLPLSLLGSPAGWIISPQIQIPWNLRMWPVSPPQLYRLNFVWMFNNLCLPLLSIDNPPPLSELVKEVNVSAVFFPIVFCLWLTYVHTWNNLYLPSLLNHSLVCNSRLTVSFSILKYYSLLLQIRILMAVKCQLSVICLSSQLSVRFFSWSWILCVFTVLCHPVWDLMCPVTWGVGLSGLEGLPGVLWIVLLPTSPPPRSPNLDKVWNISFYPPYFNIAFTFSFLISVLHIESFP